MKAINNILERDLNETELIHSFQDACSNKEFYQFIKTLPIEEEILMKYTSSLEDALIEHKNCKNCKGLEHCKNNVVGYCYTPEKENRIIKFSYVACKWKEKDIEENAYKENLELFDMPKEIKEASLKDVYTDDKSRVPIIRYFKEFIEKYNKKENPKGLYLTGSFGSGKHI